MGWRPPPPSPWYPEEDEPAERGRDAAEERSHREDAHAGEVEALAAHEAGEVAPQRQHHGVGHQVRGQHPGGLLHRGREVPRDVRQRHVGHAGVEDLHEGRDHHREGDDPWVDATVGAHREKLTQRDAEGKENAERNGSGAGPSSPRPTAASAALCVSIFLLEAWLEQMRCGSRPAPHDPLDPPILQRPSPEIEQEPDGLPGESKVAVDLGAVDIQEALHCLKLHDDGVIHDEV